MCRMKTPKLAAHTFHPRWIFDVCVQAGSTPCQACGTMIDTSTCQDDTSDDISICQTCQHFRWYCNMSTRQSTCQMTLQIRHQHVRHVDMYEKTSTRQIFARKSNAMWLIRIQSILCMDGVRQNSTHWMCMKWGRIGRCVLRYYRSIEQDCFWWRDGEPGHSDTADSVMQSLDCVMLLINRERWNLMEWSGCRLQVGCCEIIDQVIHSLDCEKLLINSWRISILGHCGKCDADFEFCKSFDEEVQNKVLTIPSTEWSIK